MSKDGSQNSLRRILYDELQSRKARNASYSLRSFARGLGVGTSTLSEFFQGSRQLSPKMARKLLDRLGASPKDRAQVVSRFAEEMGLGAVFPEKGAALIQYKELGMDQFALIADPIHYEVLCAMELDGFKGTVREIQKTLGARPQVIQSALERLARLGLARFEKRRWSSTQEDLTSTADIPSGVIQRSHREGLRKAEEALERLPVEARDFSSLVMTIDSGRIAEAKEALRRFRREFARDMESGKKNSVYRLSIQFFPVLKPNLKGDSRS